MKHTKEQSLQEIKTYQVIEQILFYPDKVIKDSALDPFFIDGDQFQKILGLALKSIPACKAEGKSDNEILTPWLDWFKGSQFGILAFFECLGHLTQFFEYFQAAYDRASTQHRQALSLIWGMFYKDYSETLRGKRVSLDSMDRAVKEYRASRTQILSGEGIGNKPTRFYVDKKFYYLAVLMAAINEKLDHCLFEWPQKQDKIALPDWEKIKQIRKTLSPQNKKKQIQLIEKLLED